MFDISWSELLILGVVTLIFVGPKELPVFLRTLGRYAGMARRQANEFKAQFDAAMREAELDSMRKEVEKMQTSINSEVMKAKSSINDAAEATKSQLGVTAPPPVTEALPQPPMPATPSETKTPEMSAAAGTTPSIAKTES
jgi:sec-independent protein translocase protein TatB